MWKLAKIIFISLFRFPKLLFAVKDNISHDLPEILLFSLKEYLQKKIQNQNQSVDGQLQMWSLLLSRIIRDPTCSYSICSLLQNITTKTQHPIGALFNSS